jgi:hypothetical protein
VIWVNYRYGVLAQRTVTIRREPADWIERFPGVFLEDHPEMPSAFGLELISHHVVADMYNFADARYAWALRALLRWRDAIWRSWATYCHDVQVVPAGERTPWPRWASRW